MGFSENLIFLSLQFKKNHVSTACLVKKKLGKAFMPLVIIRLIYFAESYDKVDTVYFTESYDKVDIFR